MGLGEAVFLVGREAQQERVAALLDDRGAGLPRSLLLHGEPGVGKTALLAAACHQAAQPPRRFCVVRATGVPAEAHLPHGVLGVLAAQLSAAQPALPAPLAVALERALGLVPAPGASGEQGPPPALRRDPMAVYVAMLALVSAAAEERPLLVAVDDAQWVDTESAEALVFTARRAIGDRVAFLVVERTPLRPEERTPFDEAGIDTETIPPLDAATSLALLRRTAPGPLSPRVATALTETCAGNPLALTVLPGTLTAAERSGSAPLPDHWRPDTRLERLLTVEFERQPHDAAALLLLLAAAGTVPEDVVLQAAGGAAASDALLALARSGLVKRDDGRVTLRQPLYASLLSARATVLQRRAAHRALADAYLASSHASSADSAAWHAAAAACGPDADIADAVERYAARAADRGGYASAAQIWARAAELTPVDDVRRLRRFLAGARAAHSAGDPGRARTLLDAATSLASTPTDRADVEEARALLEAWSCGPAAGWGRLVRAADEVEPHDVGHAARLLASGAAMALVAGEVRRGVAVARRAHVLAREAGDEDLVTDAERGLAAALVLDGDVPTALSLLTDAPPPPDVGCSLGPDMNAGLPLVWAGRLDLAEAHLTAVVDHARRHGALGALPLPLASLADWHRRVGSWDRAYALANEAAELAADAGQETTRAFALSVAAWVEVMRGLEAGAPRLRLAEKIADDTGAGLVRALCTTTGALDELGRGDDARALATSESLLRWADAVGLGNPLVLEERAVFAEAAMRLGRRVEAERQAAVLTDQGRRIGTPPALGLVARTDLVLADDDAAAERAYQCVLFHDADGPGQPFERARAALALGERLRGAGDDERARRHLEAAIYAFERLRAQPWIDRAAAELRAAGGASTSTALAVPLDALSPQELQVALVVGRGASNKEAAAALFLSPRTIEFHLTHVYRKLDLRSRAELARTLASVGG